ncbi:MAG: DoxX family membrane protein [Candidatus Neomarinimicrobiota bacterium]|nr:DoxX family membrane protein [Candidatus Neomarinimicrobiota bacterium]
MSPKTLKTVSRYIMSLFYVSVGINHFLNPEWFVKIVPPILLEFDYQLVYLSGVCEVMFGLLILIPKARYYAAWGLILTLAAVFPANIYLAQTNGVAMDTTAAVAWYRLPFQTVFILLAYWHRN